MATIEITAEPVKTLDVNLVGVDYDVKPPKGSLAIVLASSLGKIKDNPDKLMRILGDWVRVAFGKKQAEAVMKRLEDPDDDLDITHIMQLMEKLAEATTGNPTT